MKKILFLLFGFIIGISAFASPKIVQYQCNLDSTYISQYINDSVNYIYIFAVPKGMDGDWVVGGQLKDDRLYIHFPGVNIDYIINDEHIEKIYKYQGPNVKDWYSFGTDYFYIHLNETIYLVLTIYT